MGRTGVGTLCLWLCAVVWLANGQNYVNVARDKTYSQSSQLDTQGPSSKAANGDTSGIFPANCIHTISGNGDWWEVDLGETYAVYSITVWARTEFKQRLYPSNITVDDQTCASMTSFPTDTRYKNVTCSSVMYGRTVRITRQPTQQQSGDDRTLNLCEMEIWECVSGWYGDQCSTACSPGCQDTCNLQTGHCSCKAEYTGDKCAECANGYYRTSSDTCGPCSINCQASRCDKDTGTCQGCVVRHYGARCNRSCLPANCLRCHQDTGVCTECEVDSKLQPPDCKDCFDGYYKPSDNTGCDACRGTCQSGTVCDKTTGFCPLCPPGKQGDYCEEDCDSGRYGENCTGHCGHCLIKQDTSHCNAVTGHCMHGCQNGWQPSSLCNEACQDGWYGNNCSMQCGSCLNGDVCNKSTGHCSCTKGKQPPSCTTDCQNKRYGQDCAESCGQCRGGQTCDPVTGHCSDGCQPGWTDLTRSDVHLCQSECADGFYGEGCNQTCGNCQVSSECRHDTGQCTGQCVDGFTGLYCAEVKKDKDETVNTSVIVGAVVGLFIGVCIIILAVVLWALRSRIVSRQSRTTTDNPEVTASPASVRPADRGKANAVFHGVTDEEEHYESVGDILMTTKHAHPGTSTNPDTTTCVYPGTSTHPDTMSHVTEADNPYDLPAEQYSNTGEVHLYDPWRVSRAAQPDVDINMTAHSGDKGKVPGEKGNDYENPN